MKELLILERRIFAYSNGVPQKKDRDYFRCAVMKCTKDGNAMCDEVLKAIVSEFCIRKGSPVVLHQHYKRTNNVVWFSAELKQWADMVVKWYNELTVKTV